MRKMLNPKRIRSYTSMTASLALLNGVAMYIFDNPADFPSWLVSIADIGIPISGAFFILVVCFFGAFLAGKILSIEFEISHSPHEQPPGGIQFMNLALFIVIPLELFNLLDSMFDHKMIFNLIAAVGCTLFLAYFYLNGLYAEKAYNESF